MKILIDGRFYGLEHAGLGRYTINLIACLQKIDKQNSYAILLRRNYFNKLKLARNWRKILAEVPHYSLREQIELIQIISREKPDVFHCLNPNVPIFYSGNLIVTVHDLTQLKFENKATTLPLPIYYLKHLGYRLVFKKALTHSSKIIVPSNFVKKELIKSFGIFTDKISVIYEGVDYKVSPKVSSPRVLKKYSFDSDYFIYVGNAYPHKNLERVIEAVKLLNNELDRNILFLIVSSRSVFAKRLENFIKKLRVEKFVKLLGFVPDEELGVLLKNSIAFVFPSLEEGFGLPGLEAMSAETLVLASDIPVFKEIYKDNVIYFSPYESSSIKKAMKQALEMAKVERENIIKKNKSFIKIYSWTKMAEETLKVYESCFGL